MIPNNIILTYKNNNIPQYVFSNVKSLNPDKEVLFFTDENIIDFLAKECDSSYLDFFQGLSLGCSKSDFFRYCYLYKYGGYYADVDIEHIASISRYIDHNTEFFSINSGACPNSTFQALLFCVPEHEIIKNCIIDMMKPESKNDPFHYCTRDMYKNIKNYIHESEVVSKDYYKEDKIIGIGQEIPVNNRWGCIYKGRPIAFSRYQTYQKIAPGTGEEVGYFI